MGGNCDVMRKGLPKVQHPAFQSDLLLDIHRIICWEEWEPCVDCVQNGHLETANSECEQIHMS